MAKLKDFDVEVTDWTKENAPESMRAFMERTRKN